MRLPRQEYWTGLLFPSPGGLPNAETEPRSPALAGGFFTTGHLGSPLLTIPLISASFSLTLIDLGISVIVHRYYHHLHFRDELKLRRVNLGVCSVFQLCLTLCDPTDCSPPGSSVRGIFQQEHWSGLPLPPPGDLPDPGIKPVPPASQPDPLPLSHRGSLLTSNPGLSAAKTNSIHTNTLFHIQMYIIYTLPNILFISCLKKY